MVKLTTANIHGIYVSLNVYLVREYIKQIQDGMKGCEKSMNTILSVYKAIKIRSFLYLYIVENLQKRQKFTLSKYI